GHEDSLAKATCEKGLKSIHAAVRILNRCARRRVSRKRRRKAMFAPGENEKRTIELQRSADSQSSALKSAAFRLFAHTALVVGAIFVVTVLLAAMPGHNTPTVSAVITQQEGSSQSPSAGSQQMEGMDHSKMAMDPDEKTNEGAAVNEMNHMHGSGAHLHM